MVVKAAPKKKKKQQQEGHLVSIEGIDAAGKKTQSLLLNTWFQRNNHPSKVMAFPDYETPIGMEIKNFLSGKRRYPPQVRHMLFAANRWEKFGEIKDWLDAGRTLIVNRYTESNLVYGVANGLDADWLLGLEKGLPVPDLVIVLDAPPKDVAQRRPNSHKDVYEDNYKMQEEARKGYRSFAKRLGWTLIPATGSIDSVHASIANAVKKSSILLQ